MKVAAILLLIALDLRVLAQTADLGISKSVNNASPLAGEIITYSITLTNHGPNTATGVTNVDLLPANVVYVSHSNGAYHASSGLWPVPTLSAGSATTLFVNARVVGRSGLCTTIDKPTPNIGQFGSSVASLGLDCIIVGAPRDFPPVVFVGKAYLFSTVGNLLVTISNPAPSIGDGFGASIAVLGQDRVVISAPADDVGAMNSGVVYLFNTNAGLLVTVTNPTPDNNDNFGSSVANLGSDRFIVGATNDDIGATDAGSAYLYDSNGNLLVTISNPAPAAADYFGGAVAGLGQNRIIVGASQDDAGSTDAGSVYVYETNGALTASIANPAPGPGDNFGVSVAGLGPDRIIIGAPQDDAGATNAGSVYLFSMNGTLLATISNPAPAQGDAFGSAVAGMGTDRILVGAPQDDGGAVDAGSVYLFDTNGLLLATVTNPVPSVGDAFGNSLSFCGTNRVAVGAYMNILTSTPLGSVYIYDQDFSGGGRIDNTASKIAQAELDPIATNDSFVVTSYVGSTCDFSVTKSQTLAVAYLNQTNIYSIIASNVGSTTVTAVRVREILPDGFTLISNSVSGGIFDQGSTIWSLATLAPGASESLTLSVRVTGTSGIKINTAKFDSADQTDINDSNDVSSVALLVNPVLSIRTPYGTTLPATGDYVYAAGNIVTASVSPLSFTNGLLGYTAVGWSMAGNEPSSGVGTQVVMTITNNAFLQWIWDISYFDTNGLQVNTTNDILNDFDGLLSLREAVVLANIASTEIFLSNETYRLTIAGANEDDALTGDLDIHNAVQLIGKDIAPATVSAGGLNDRVFQIASNAAATFSNLVIRGGNAGTNAGGGLLCLGTTFVENCTINANSGRGGGGLFNLGPLVRIENSRITGNGSADGMNGDNANFTPAQAGYAGGGLHSSAGIVQIFDSMIQSNSAGSGGSGANETFPFVASPGATGGNGGGMYLAGGQLTIIRSVVIQNKAGNGGAGGWGSRPAGGGGGGFGGGIYCASGVLTASNSTLSGNAAGTGGGGGSTFAFEVCGSPGGGGGTGGAVFSDETSFYYHVTITSNTPGFGGGGGFGDGGGVPCNGAAGSPGTFGGIAGPAVLANSILANNSGSNGTVTSLGFNLINTNPLVGPLAQNGGATPTHALHQGSPALNSGDLGYNEWTGSAGISARTRTRRRYRRVRGAESGRGPRPNSRRVGNAVWIKSDQCCGRQLTRRCGSLQQLGGILRRHESDEWCVLSPHHRHYQYDRRVCCFSLIHRPFVSSGIFHESITAGLANGPQQRGRPSRHDIRPGYQHSKVQSVPGRGRSAVVCDLKLCRSVQRSDIRHLDRAARGGYDLLRISIDDKRVSGQDALCENAGGHSIYYAGFRCVRSNGRPRDQQDRQQRESRGGRNNHVFNYADQQRA